MLHKSCLYHRSEDIRWHLLYFLFVDEVSDNLKGRLTEELSDKLSKF